MGTNAKTFLKLLFYTFCNSVLAWLIISLYESLRGILDLSCHLPVFCLIIGAFLTFIQSEE